MKDSRSRYALLGMLTLGPMSGYDIKRVIGESISAFWAESYGQIYPILRRLEAEGLATRARSGKKGTRERQVYSITTGGRAELARWLAEPVRQQGWRVELLLKLFFGRQAPLSDSLVHLKAFREFHHGLLAKYAESERALTRERSSHPDYPFWLITIRYGQRMSRTLVEWADESLKTLGKMEKRRKASPAD